MPNFANAPHCRPMQVGVATPLRMQGNRITAWQVEFEDGIHTMTDTELRERGMALGTDDAGAGYYAILGAEDEPRRFEVDLRERRVHIEGREDTIPLDAFIGGHLRTDDTGRAMCAFAEPLHQQWTKLRESGTRGTLHLHDLRMLVEYRREEGLSSDVSMYDMVSAGLEDEKSYLDRLASATAEIWPQSTTLAFHALSERGLPREAWMDLKDTPQYGLPPVRAMFEMLMEDRLAGFPMEQVRAIATEDHDSLVALLDAEAELVAEEDSFEPRNVMPGYRTSPVRHYRLEGVDIIHFSDMMGSYAYAWPTPEPAPKARM